MVFCVRYKFGRKKCNSIGTQFNECNHRFTNYSIAFSACIHLYTKTIKIFLFRFRWNSDSDPEGFKICDYMLWKCIFFFFFFLSHFYICIPLSYVPRCLFRSDCKFFFSSSFLLMERRTVEKSANFFINNKHKSRCMKSSMDGCYGFFFHGLLFMLQHYSYSSDFFPFSCLIFLSNFQRLYHFSMRNIVDENLFIST